MNTQNVFILINNQLLSTANAKDIKTDSYITNSTEASRYHGSAQPYFNTDKALIQNNFENDFLYYVLGCQLPLFKFHCSANEAK